MTEQTVPYIVKDIPLSDILFPNEEMRSFVAFEGLDELSRSIRQLGLLNPITVRPKGAQYELIAGFRRTKACEMAGMLTVPARVINSDDTTADLQKAHENIFREDVNALDEGSYYKILLAKHNWKLQDLATVVHKSLSYVDRRVRLTECFEDVREALKDGKINLSIAEELGKIKDEATRRRLLYLCVVNGATVDVVRSWRVQSEIMNNQGMQQQEGGAPIDPNAPPVDPGKMGKLTDDHGPEFQLNETIKQFRICHSCLARVDAEKAKLLILCEECATAIEPHLAGGIK